MCGFDGLPHITSKPDFILTIIIIRMIMIPLWNSVYQSQECVRLKDGAFFATAHIHVCSTHLKILGFPMCGAY